MTVTQPGGALQPRITDPRIRPMTREDVARTADLIYELADYEKLRHHCHITPAQLEAALFSPAPALFGLAAFDSAESGAQQVGFALYFRNFSTWEGVHGLYLEDLYVSPEMRGHGLGKALLQTLAATAIHHGYARVEWWVLDWNAPSISFYESLGARPMDEWTVFRLDGAALQHTATAS